MWKERARKEVGWVAAQRHRTATQYLNFQFCLEKAGQSQDGCVISMATGDLSKGSSSISLDIEPYGHMRL